MRNVARIKLGYYPLSPDEGSRLRQLLNYPSEPVSALDPCAGTGAALLQLTDNANANRYAVELDAERARLSFTGTAEELEAELGPTLVSYTGSHLQLKSTLENAQAEMDAAAKAAKVKAQHSSKTPAKKEVSSEGSSSNTAKPTPAATPAAPAKPTEPKTASLFDMPPLEQQAAAPPSPAPIEREDGDEDDILAEINEGDTQEDVTEDLDAAA
jgi:hypothetical protein